MGEPLHGEAAVPNYCRILFRRTNQDRREQPWPRTPKVTCVALIKTTSYCSLSRKTRRISSNYRRSLSPRGGTLERKSCWSGQKKSTCGSCWDFSGTGIVEIAFNKAGIGGGPKKFILSEQYSLSCYRNGGCGGDDNTTVLDWAKGQGLPLTKDYGEYKNSATACRYKLGMPLYKLDDWGFADSRGKSGVAPVKDIKAAIMHYGAVGCGVSADNTFTKHRAGTVFEGRGTAIDHDVILVGWDDATNS